MNIFGARWSGYEKKLEDNWRKAVSDGDTVIIDGDISWAMTTDGAKPDFDFIESLPGNKIICKGNHDFWWQSMNKLNTFVAQNGYKTIKFLYNNAYAVENFIICGSRGWYSDEKDAPLPESADPKKIVAREVLRLGLSFTQGKILKEQAAARGENPEILAFLHFPAIFRGYICDEIIRELYINGVKRCFYGHIHGNYESPAVIEYSDMKFYLISADYLDFMPYEIKENN